MKIVTKIELSQNEKTFIEQLKELSMHIHTEKAFDCKGLDCKDCPFHCNGCEVDNLQFAIKNFIESTEEI